MRNVLFYYGWLNSFNSARNAWTNDLVADQIAHCYDVLVLGDGLESPTHGDYANTTYIVAKLKTIKPELTIYGYVDTTLPLANFQTNVDNWNVLKVHGIFMDKAGYDFGTHRADFNTRVDYIHGKVFSNMAFANAWNQNHIMGLVNDVSFPNTTFNPGLVDTHLQPGDAALLESLGILSSTGLYEDPLEMFTRVQTASLLRKQYGVQMMSASAFSNTDPNGQAKFDWLWDNSWHFSLDAMGSSDVNYGASSAAVKYWSRKHIGY